MFEKVFFIEQRSCIVNHQKMAINFSQLMKSLMDDS